MIFLPIIVDFNQDLFVVYSIFLEIIIYEHMIMWMLDLDFEWYLNGGQLLLVLLYDMLSATYTNKIKKPLVFA